jgi:hypothetical protein
LPGMAPCPATGGVALQSGGSKESHLLKLVSRQEKALARGLKR